MADQKHMHTVPTEDGRANRREGAQRASSTHTAKDEVPGAGRTATKRNGVEHLIHDGDGTIGNRSSQGNDPDTSKG